MKPYQRHLLKAAVCLIVACSVLPPSAVLGGGLYRWVDDEGTVHMTDNVSSIPPRYRDQAKERRLQSEAESEAPSPESGAASNATTAPGQRLEIPYQAFEGSSRRIILPVTFNESVTAPMLLDTGSPGLMISPELAERLGLVNGDEGGLKITAGGIGGRVPAMLAIVDSISVGEARSEFLPATIAPIPSEEFEGLVGMDFLSNYKISIEGNRSVLLLEALPPHPNRPGGHDEVWWRSNFYRISSMRAEWRRFLDTLEKESVRSSEGERLKKLALEQLTAADEIYHRLERYARDHAVSSSWRR